MRLCRAIGERAMLSTLSLRRTRLGRQKIGLLYAIGEAHLPRKRRHLHRRFVLA